MRVLSAAALAAPMLFGTGAIAADVSFPGTWSNVTLTSNCRLTDKVEFTPTTFRHGSSTDAVTYERLSDGKVLINFLHGSEPIQLAAERKGDRLFMTTLTGAVCEYLPPAAAEALFTGMLKGAWHNGGDNALSFVFDGNTLTITDKADPSPVVIAMRRLSAENGYVVFGDMDLPGASPAERAKFREAKKDLIWSFDIGDIGADGTLDLMIASLSKQDQPHRATLHRGANPHAEAAIKAGAAKSAEAKATVAAMKGAWSVTGQGQSLGVLQDMVEDGGTLTITETEATYEVDVKGMSFSMTLTPDTSKSGPSDLAIYKVSKYSTNLGQQHAAEVERIASATWVLGIDGKTLRVESDKGAEITFARKR